MEFLLLGPVEVHGEGGTVAVGGKRSRSVLAALLLQPNRVVSVEQIVDATWSERPPAGARVQAQNRVSRLRRIVPEAIVTSGSGYLIRVDEERIDAVRFARGVARAEQRLAAGAAETAVTELAAALALWRGPALHGLETPYLTAAAHGLEEQRIRAVERRIEIELDLGRHQDLVAELTALAAGHPYRERLHALLMQALYRCGRQAEALDVYRRARTDLADQLGLEPGELLRRAHETVLRGHLAVTDGTSVRSRPREAQEEGPRELPADVPAFTGRAEALDALTTQAATAAIVTIAGSAGVGKTALAVHWAHRNAHRFPDGQLYVNLRGYDAAGALSPIAVLAQFLRALGTPAGKVPVDEPEAAALFRSAVATKRLLILLDNAHSVEQIRPLLPGGRGTVVLVTSRDRLAGLVAREGARQLTVGVFSPAESLALLAQVLGADRVAVEPDAAAELAALCAQLPLALRVAAANLTARPHRTIGQHAAALRDGNRLAALAVDDDVQAAVRGAFDLSYQAIRPPEQRMFRLLGLVPGPDLTAGAAAALAEVQPAEAERLLDRLAATHLIQEHGPGRYTLHDLLRAYARAQADEDPESTPAKDRLFDWYLATTDAADRRRYPERMRAPLPRPVGSPAFADQAEASAWLDAEQVNLVAAVRHAAEHGPRPAAWLIACALAGHFNLGLHVVDWLAAMTAGLSAAEAAADLAGQASTHHSLAIARRLNGDTAASIAHAERALALAGEIGWPKGQAVAHSVLASGLWQSGDLPAAVDQLTQCLALYRRIGETAGQAINLSNLGILHGELGQLDRAIDCQLQALELLKAVDGHVLDGGFLATLGHFEHLAGRLDDALEHLDRALNRAQQHGDRSKTVHALRYLADIHRDLGNHELARQHALEALAILDDGGELRAVADATNTLGTIDHAMGRPAEAAEQHQRALRIATDNELRYPRVEALIGLAAARTALGEHQAARSAATEALDQARKSGFRLLEERAIAQLPITQAT